MRTSLARAWKSAALTCFFASVPFNSSNTFTFTLSITFKYSAQLPCRPARCFKWLIPLDINWLQYLQRNFYVLVPTLIACSQHGYFNLDPLTVGTWLDAAEEDIFICTFYFKIDSKYNEKWTIGTLKSSFINNNTVLFESGTQGRLSEVRKILKSWPKFKTLVMYFQSVNLKHYSYCSKHNNILKQFFSLN